MSEAGVGTVAAGVAKAYADYVLVSGFDGGTGASPLTSIKHAGSPWELGVAETQQVLVRNGLRGRAAAAHRRRPAARRATSSSPRCWAPRSSASAPPAWSRIGCDMARQCHLNTCPTGIATQRAELRAKFNGTPEQVIDFFMHLAEEIRELLASARPALASTRPSGGSTCCARRARCNGVDLSARAGRSRPERHPAAALHPAAQRPTRRSRAARREPAARGAGRRWPTVPRFKAARMIRNRDRTVGARIAGEIGAGRLQPPRKADLAASGRCPSSRCASSAAPASRSAPSPPTACG